MTNEQDSRAVSLRGLAARLRDLRDAADPSISQAAAARHLVVSQSKVSRAERGDFLLKPEEVSKLATLYRATPEDAKQLVGWAEALREERLDSRLIFQRGRNYFQKRVKSMEEASALVRSYQPGMIIGSVQTRAYVETVMNQSGKPDANSAVEARLERNRMMLEDAGREWVLIQTEGSLRWPISSPGVMAEQLDYLVECSRLPNVRLGMISHDRPVQFAAPHGFHIYDRQAVQIGTKTATALTSDPRDLREYQDLFARLEGVAAWGDEARDVIARVAAEYREKRRP